MKKSITRGLILMFLILVLILTGCTQNTSATLGDSEEIVITDMLGRKVTLTSTDNTAVALGPGALRLYCYVANTDDLVGIEQLEIDNPIGRPYMMANPALVDLPIIGQGGPANAPDPEKLITASPDVIFTMYNSDAAAVDELQSKTGIPVIALTYGQTEAFDPDLDKSLSIIGQVMGEEERAQEVIDFFAQCKEDLNDRTKDIADEDKATVYLGSQSMRGTHGIESTSGNYSLFNVVNAINVVDLEGISEYVMLDKEKLLDMDPEYIFIDIAGLSIVMEDFNSNAEYYNGLSAFKNGKVYSQLPYNYYYTNIDVAICDAYYIGKIIYPDKFADIDIQTKADEIFEFLVGKEIYDDLANDFHGGFMQLTFE